MRPGVSPRRYLALGLLAALGLAYLVGLLWQTTLLGSHQLDGSLGILLGLYLGSHPAANSIDLMFLGGGERARYSSAPWLALNGLVLLVSLLVIALGAVQFTARN